MFSLKIHFKAYRRTPSSRYTFGIGLSANRKAVQSVWSDRHILGQVCESLFQWIRGEFEASRKRFVQTESLYRSGTRERVSFR